MNNAAGMVLPGLWVGSLLSVYNLTRLIQHSNENKEVVVSCDGDFSPIKPQFDIDDD